MLTPKLFNNRQGTDLPLLTLTLANVVNGYGDSNINGGSR